LGSAQASGVVETWVWTADKRQQAAGGASRFSRKNDWIAQVIPQQAIKAMRDASALYSKKVARRQELAGSRSWDGTFYLKQYFLLRR
jgi:hypothetical protein